MSTREERVWAYYENPNRCKHCEKIIEVKDTENPSETKRRKFCNRSCSASFNNTGKTKNVLGTNGTAKEDIKSKVCPQCGGPKVGKADICKECHVKNTHVAFKTLGYYIEDEQYLTSKCQAIRSDARRVIESSTREKMCVLCKNHDFDSILEVHHVKGILEFTKESFIYQINDEDNLIWVCPNHHAMIEKKLIKI
jgi:hypothetical protein